MYKHRHLWFSFILLSFAACGTNPVLAPQDTIFEEIDPKKAGITFENNLPYSEQVNCYLFKNFYNGGGVAVGDVNQDGLPDVFFCGNRASNRLYLNKGDFKFEDITDRAGLRSDSSWSSGASFVDVNGDGYLDLYVCKSGPPDLRGRENQLFINNGDATFSDKAAEYGVNVKGLSAHAVFFDYDHDGDADFYLLSNSIRSVGGYDLKEGRRAERDPQGANRFYRNDGGKFTDVSKEAGIYGSNIGFGLGVAVGDYNRDGWQDMFVSNDFFERDYLYLNTRKGKFEEVGDKSISEMSMGSMGADIADMNNDCYPDIYVTEMLPSDYRRYKTKTQFDNWNKFALTDQSGYHHQYSRNVLQLNDGAGRFQEVGRYAGVEATDWSWGALLCDFDMDGWKDIFVANGIGKDLLDQDYLQFYSDPEAVRQTLQQDGKGIVGLIDKMPSVPQMNQLFRNEGVANVPKFENITAKSGFQKPTFSNGSVYADLDNDGDTDLIVNNLDGSPGIFKNKNTGKKNWLTVVVKADAPNHFGLGAQVTIKTKDGYQFQEISPMRGFQSCTDTRLHFGLGDATVIDSLWCSFPMKGGQKSPPTFVQTAIKANQILNITQAQAQGIAHIPAQTKHAVLPQNNALTQHQHQQGFMGDFDREPLLFHMYSTAGPALATADVNHDGLDDCFIGGGVGQSGAIFLQTKSGDFVRSSQPAFDAHKDANDVAAVFFDANADGHADLYVGSGCNGSVAGHSSLADRLYINDGKGHFSIKTDALPGSKPFGTAWVKSIDLNRDGATDVLVGMRAVNGRYGAKAGVFALMNDGKSRFSPDMQRIQYDAERNRMSTAAELADFDADDDLDLVVMFDWGAPVVMLNQSGVLTQSKTTGLESYTGWWSSVMVCDINKDRKLDMIAGNHGQNSRFKASPKQPLTLYLNDIDANGTIDPLVTMWFGDQVFPFAQRADLVKQMPLLKKHILKSEVFSSMQLRDLEAKMSLPSGLTRDSLQVTTLQSVAFIQQENGAFKAMDLPAEAQLSPIFAMQNLEHSGMLLAGNQLYAKPECGGNQASGGVVLDWKNDQLVAEKAMLLGIYLDGDVRNLDKLQGLGGSMFYIATRTNGTPILYKVRATNIIIN
jgi:enediyne biosynthesis protein E4